MDWGDSLLEFATEIGKGIFETTSERVSLPSETSQGFADDKPQPRSYQGAPGRNHDNSTVICDGPANYNDSERQVLLACRVVGGGFGGGMLGMLTKLATDAVIPASLGIPNPIYHWCITVGDYLHQLQSTSLKGGWNYYTNERIDQFTGGWTFYPVGNTTLNDVAIKDVSTKVMNEMPEIYHAFNNNCQTFSLRLVDRILNKARVQKYLMANLTLGMQKAPEIDIKMLPGVTVTRIDTGEVFEPQEIEPEVHRAPAEEAPAPEMRPLVVGEEAAHGVPVEVAGAGETRDEETEISGAEMLRNVARIMIENTPTLTKEDIEVAERTSITPNIQLVAA